MTAGIARESIIQTFLDAAADPQVFCWGQIPVYAPDDSGPSREPNCGVANECPLYRPPSYSLKMWSPGMAGTAEHGCQEFRLLTEWKKSQQYWLVQFTGRDAQEVQARDAQSAACTAWWESLRSGDPIDKMALLDRRYTVREA